MSDEELEKLFGKLDDRYVTREDFKKEVVSVANALYATRDDYIASMAKIEAFTKEQQMNTQLLNDIYQFLQDNKSQDAETRARLKLIETKVDNIKKGNLRVFISSRDPFMLTLKTFLFALAMFITLMIFSMMIGQKANIFMSKNGGYVAMFTLISSSIINYVGGRHHE